LEWNAERTRSKISLICGRKNRYRYSLLCSIRSAEKFQKVTLISFQESAFSVLPRTNAQILISSLIIHPSFFNILRSTFFLSPIRSFSFRGTII
jgi:hypothetical protein